AYALITVVSGDGQVMKVGNDSQDVKFKVIDEQGNPSTRGTVKFQLTNPSGSTVVLTGLTIYRAEPNENGEVTTRLQNPKVIGNYIVIAKLESDISQVANAVVIVESLQDNKPPTNEDDPIIDPEFPGKLSLISGSQQTVKAGLDSTDIIFQVTDEQGNPITGEMVEFQLQDATGNITTAQNLTVYESLPDEGGQVKTRLQATGEMGNYTVVAKLKRNLLQSVSANLVVNAGLVDIFKVIAGNNQTITTGKTSANISFQLIDAFNNNISGRTVNFQMLAPDSSVIDSSTANSDINGIVIIRLQPVSVKGNYIIEATTDNDKTAQATVQVLMAIPILPSLKFGVTFNKEFELIDSKDIFYGGIAVNSGDFSQETVLNSGDSVIVQGFINVADEHVGKKADIILVANYKPLNDEELFFMVGEGLNIQVWNGDLNSLVAYETAINLEKNHIVSIYEGKLNDIGTWKVYFGYRLQDGKIMFNGNQGINCVVN
ncbi:hypothetical protein QUF50_04560, partial [Thiotrichales bacterium HSG1]|nr:hypothetical protein [Thiotrichales bacterium HSG1]